MLLKHVDNHTEADGRKNTRQRGLFLSFNEVEKKENKVFFVLFYKKTVWVENTLLNAPFLLG